MCTIEKLISPFPVYKMLCFGNPDVIATIFHLLKAFSEEIAFAIHLALSAIQISLKGRDCINLARCLNEQLQGSSNQTVRYKCCLLTLCDSF